MKALVVSDFEKVPTWSDFKAPSPQPGHVIVNVKAAALSNLVKGKTNGSHYSSVARFPFVPGMDGIGTLPGGKRVFFFSSELPYGAMGEKTLVKEELCVPVPDNLSDGAAASIANPIMSSWAALVYRAKIKKGETVLVNGATGSAGRLAVKIAKHLGAKKVIATGRDASSLNLLLTMGADEVISLTDPVEKLAQNLQNAFEKEETTIVLDYLWGDSASALFKALGAAAQKHKVHQTVRYVQIGSISGQTISLPASFLRSGPVEIMGSGLGSVSDQNLVASIGEAFKVASQLKLLVESKYVPMSQAETIWETDTGRDRIVFTL